MLEAENKVGKIEALQQQLKDLNAQANQTSYWLKLSKMCENLSSDQQEYISTSEEVKKAKAQMVEAFNLFLFENFKEQFASNETFLKYCDRYVDSIQDAISDYRNNMKKIIDENIRLKNELNEIKKGGYCED